MKYLLDRSPVDQDQLSPEGRKLIQDCRDIIETARLIVQEKNADELFQNFMWNTNSVDLGSARKDPNEILPVDRSKAKDDGRQGLSPQTLFSIPSTHSPTPYDAAARHLRTLGNLIATNSEVRKMLSDFSVLGRDILARTVSHAAEAIRPNRDALTKVDQSAPSDHFETAGSSQLGPNGTPVAELGISGSNTAIHHHPLQGTEVEHEGQVRSATQAADEARGRVDEVKDTVEYVFLAHLLSYRFNWFDSLRGATDGDADSDTKKTGVVGRLQNLKASVRAEMQSCNLRLVYQNGWSDNVSQERKDALRDKIEQGRNVLVEDYFPEDRRDQFIYRIKKVT